MEPQLLTVVDKSVLQKWKPDEWGKWQFEPKLDGARCLIVGGVPQSRTGKPFYNLESVLSELSRCTGLCTKDVVLDGEIVGADWADTMSTIRASKSDRDMSRLRFVVFDLLTLDEWNHQSCGRTLFDRQQLLQEIVTPTEHIQTVKYYRFDHYEQFEDFYGCCLKLGCDGVVLKQTNSTYEFKRTKTWLKVKPDQTFDGTVVGMNEGKLKYEGTLGALVFKPEGSDVLTAVSGMTDVQRRTWWTHKHKILGKTIEVKCRGIHPSGRLIEPRFVRIRDDK